MANMRATKGGQCSSKEKVTNQDENNFNMINEVDMENEDDNGQNDCDTTHFIELGLLFMSTYGFLGINHKYNSAPSTDIPPVNVSPQ